MATFVMTIECGGVVGPPALFGFQVIGDMGSLVSNTSAVFTPAILRTDDGVGPDDPQVWIQLQRADGEPIAQSDFTSVEIPGVGTFLTADADTFIYTPGDPSVAEWHWFNPPDMMPDSGELALTFTYPGVAAGFNCPCDDDNQNETLGQLRVRMMLRLGFGANANNPPPGMAATLNDFLISQNRLMYQKYPALRTRRFFRWTLEEGQRYYGLRDNDEDLDCAKYFDVTKPIEGVYLRDLNGTWIPMTAGIPPYFYTTSMQPGLPLRYEIRSCIEIFPSPQSAGYEMWIKAQHTADAFAADNDRTTVSSELVFLQALADAKAHYGKPDTLAVKARADEYLGELIGSTHTTKRYVPGERPIPPAVMPVFTPYPGE